MKKAKGYRALLALLLALMMMLPSLAALAEEAEEEPAPEEEILTGEAPEQAEEAPEVKGAAKNAETPKAAGSGGSGTVTIPINVGESSDGGVRVTQTGADLYIAGPEETTCEIDGVKITYAQESASGNSPVTVTVDGNIDYGGDKSVGGLELDNEGPRNVTVNIQGSVTGITGGAYINSIGSGNNTITVSGDAAATGTESIGAIIEASGSGENTITVEGTSTGTYRGASIYSDGSGRNTITYQGGGNTEEAPAGATGGRIDGRGTSQNTIKITGDAVATAIGTSAANVHGYNTSVNLIEVTGNASASGISCISVMGDEGTDNTVIVGGSATATGEHSGGIYVYGNGNVTVAGDVSGETGISIQYGGERDILVEGTVSGEMGIDLYYDVDFVKTDVTVWKIESTRQDATEADLVNTTGNVSQETVTSFCEKAIHYIVKLLQPSGGGKIAARKADGSALDKHHKLETAQEGDKVYVDVSTKGYRIVGAKNGDTELEKDEGGYFYTVARGGGMLFSAILEKISPPKPKPDPKPDPEPEPEPKPAATVRTYTLKFYEDAQGSAKTVTAKEGQIYTLPAAPAREGAAFVGWAESKVPPADPSWKEPAEGDESILAPGTQYQVTGARCFVGIWKKD